MKTTSERGKFKMEINNALYKNPDIIDLLIGDTTGLKQGDIVKSFKEHVNSHLFIDDTITDTSTFIFYDVSFPSLKNNVKSCSIVMYLITHRSTLENYTRDGYYGDRIDILSQMVEDTLINNEDVANSFGIGRLSLDSIYPYNSERMYGCIMNFSVPNFR